MLAIRALKGLQQQQRVRQATAKHLQLAFRGFSTEDGETEPVVATEDFGVIASIPLAQATEKETSKFFPFLKETQDKLVPEGINKRTEATFDLVGHRHLMLRENTSKIISIMQDWENSKKDSTGAFVIDGDRGCGKTLALQQIVQYARERNWLVLYVPQARSWCYEAPYVIPSPYMEGKYDIDAYGVELLEKFLHCHGEQLSSIPLRGDYGDRYYPESFAAKPKDPSEYDNSTLTLRDLVVNGIRDEELACVAVVDLRAELAKVTEFPVLIAVDEYNEWFGKTVFGYDNVDVTPFEISVIDALADIREDGLVEDRKLSNGLFIAATTENYPSKRDFKKQVNYRAHRSTMRPYSQDELKNVIAYYNQVHFLHDKPTDSELAYFRLMTKSVPLSVFDRASFS
ncbi:hypothetical protein Poli38472_012696 [Pythium oligandrum]|uniref:Small ribosomal subunit protein mS29 n=1 Tax=Pythium oligandrum TaxID=41045 RepID=A0A8K1CET8_PYTOL|nr:hypothetical protein Poli38472_012696 [Pythium oligandrum]|eukprot:TMW61505.1 hypothetical protein Poli38472_012696 [Pythium oligandrum]